jgi:hypothetical protein
MSTRKAANAITIELLVKLAFAYMLIDNFAKRRHELLPNILRPISKATMQGIELH